MEDVYAKSIGEGLAEVHRRIEDGAEGEDLPDSIPVLVDDLLQRSMALASALFFIFGAWPGTLFVDAAEIKEQLRRTVLSREALRLEIRSRPFSQNTRSLRTSFTKNTGAAMWTHPRAAREVYQEVLTGMEAVTSVIPYFSEYFAQKHATMPDLEALSSSMYEAAQIIGQSQPATSRLPVPDAAPRASSAAAAAAAASESDGPHEGEDVVVAPKKAPVKKRSAAAAAAARSPKRVVKVSEETE